MGKFIDLTGQQYNDWLVLYKDTKYTGSHIKWVCKCLACNETVKSVFSGDLRDRINQKIVVVLENKKQQLETLIIIKILQIRDMDTWQLLSQQRSAKILMQYGDVNV